MCHQSSVINKRHLPCIAESEAEVTKNLKDCTQGIVLLKVTTDKHDALCSLSFHFLHHNNWSINIVKL